MACSDAESHPPASHRAGGQESPRRLPGHGNVARARRGTHPRGLGRLVPPSRVGGAGDRSPLGSASLVAPVRPFRALRYAEAAAGPLAPLVAPPSDVVSPSEREPYLAQSAHNI